MFEFGFSQQYYGRGLDPQNQTFHWFLTNYEMVKNRKPAPTRNW